VRERKRERNKDANKACTHKRKHGDKKKKSMHTSQITSIGEKKKKSERNKDMKGWSSSLVNITKQKNRRHPQSISYQTNAVVYAMLDVRLSQAA